MELIDLTLLSPLTLLLLRIIVGVVLGILIPNCLTSTWIMIGTGLFI